MFSAYYVTDPENNKINTPSPSFSRDSGPGEDTRGKLHIEQLFCSSLQPRTVGRAETPKLEPTV